MPEIVAVKKKKKKKGKDSATLLEITSGFIPWG